LLSLQIDAPALEAAGRYQETRPRRLKAVRVARRPSHWTPRDCGWPWISPAVLAARHSPLSPNHARRRLPKTRASWRALAATSFRGWRVARASTTSPAPG